jgi:kynurenine formamidase
VCASGSRTPGEEGWTDISVPLRSGMVHWPDNPPVRIERMLDMERGDVANVSTISLGSHTGTHMDAPIHFLRGGEGMDRMPLDATIGPARVIEIQDPISIKPDEIGRGERILFKTRNSSLGWWAQDFIEGFVYVSQEAARYLAATSRTARSGPSASTTFRSAGSGKTASRRIMRSSAPGSGSSKASICRR